VIKQMRNKQLFNKRCLKRVGPAGGELTGIMARWRKS